MTSVDDHYRVLHVITRLDRGGSADNTLLTVFGLDWNRYRLSLAAGEGGGLACEIVDEFQRRGLELMVIPHLVRNINPWKDLRALWRLYRIMARGGYHLVHTHSSKAGMLGRWAARFARVPVIVHTPHGHVFYGYYGRILTKLFILMEKFTASFTDAIITLTPRGKDEHVKLGIAAQERFHVVHSGVDIDRYRAAGADPEVKRKELGLTRGEPIVLSVGRLEPVKGHRYLINAVPSVLKELPQARVLLCGDGALRGELEGLARNLGVAEEVIFLGEREDVPELLAASDLFVLPSLNEGMGRAVVEAMAAGKAVIATDVGGVPDLVADGESGLMVEAESPEQLAGAIVMLLKDEDLRRKMGVEGKNRAEEYSIDAMLEKIDALYQELLERKLRRQTDNRYGEAENVSREFRSLP